MRGIVVSSPAVELWIFGYGSLIWRPGSFPTRTSTSVEQALKAEI
jgi:cation transport regulator ChaC